MTGGKRENDGPGMHRAENPRAYERYPGTGPRIDDFWSYTLLTERPDTPEDVAERIRAFNSQPWSPSRSCLLCTCPPCAALLDDPYGVLTERTRWPEHLGADVARESVERWLLDVFLPRSGPAHEARRSLAGLWPLPVGVRSLQREVMTFGLEGVDDALMPFMPFDGDEYAALILVATIRDALVTVFGLARWDGAERDFRISGMRYIATGSTLLSSDVTPFINHAVRWWSRFEGKPLPGSEKAGRPQGEAGQTKLRYADGWNGARFSDEWEIYETAVEMAAGAENGRPSIAGFAAHLGVDVKTLNTRLDALRQRGELSADFPP